MAWFGRKAGTPRRDGWDNLLTKIGIQGRDKRLSSAVVAPYTLQEGECEALFLGNDLANRIAALPAQEATRQWIKLKIDEAEETTGVVAGEVPDKLPGKSPDKLDASDAHQADRQGLITDVMQNLQTLKAQAAVAQAITWARVFGGAIIYVGADTGAGDDPSRELKPESVRAIRFLTVFHRYEVRIAELDKDPASPTYGEPLYYEPVIYDATGKLSYGSRIHASRVIHFDGTETTRRRKRQNQGWADSVFVKLYDRLRAYDAAWDSADILIQDFSQAVIKIKGLADMMATDGEDAVKERLELLDLSRSVLRAMVMDAEHEDFERKPTPLTGLPELLDRWMHRVSAAVGIPITLLFGQSPGGMNATGESDTRFFYDSIRTYQETVLRPSLERLLRLVMSAKEGPTGAEPEGWSFEFNPLWQTSDKEKAEIRKLTADTDAVYLDRQVISPEEIAQSRWGGDEYSTETAIDLEAQDIMRQAEVDRQETEKLAAAAAFNAPAEEKPPFGG
jgi:phage-related protein (TIGR01555 family)